MMTSDFNLIKERHCKFLMRTGKLVYGVVWEVNSGEKVRHYFASSGTFSKIKNSEDLFRDEPTTNEVIPVELTDIVAAEYLSESS